eukprot:6182093-Pleurochrysis_carterae.AAC.2
MRAAKEAPMRYGPSASELQLRSALRNCSVGVSMRALHTSSGMNGAGGLKVDLRTRTPVLIA